MKKETKSMIAFFIFMMAYIPTYLAGYYAEATNGWSHLLILFAFILQAIVFIIESPSTSYNSN